MRNSGIPIQTSKCGPQEWVKLRIFSNSLARKGINIPPKPPQEKCAIKIYKKVYLKK